MAVFRVERTKDFTVMSNHHLRNRTLSLKAKGLLSLMLSLPEDWDYTMSGLAQICKDGLSSIRATIAELEEHGYLRRQRLRNRKGQLTDTEYTILERPEPPKPSPAPTCENRTQDTAPTCGFPTLDFPPEENPMVENHTQSNIQGSSTQGSSTNPINPGPDGFDAAVYRGLLMDNIGYAVLAAQHGGSRVDEVVELMLEILLCRRDTVRIAGDEFPAGVVKARLMKVNYDHVEYVFESLDRNSTPIRNIKAYLLTALFNAPATIDSYYRAEVNFDFGGNRDVSRPGLSCVPQPDGADRAGGYTGR